MELELHSLPDTFVKHVNSKIVSPAHAATCCGFKFLFPNSNARSIGCYQCHELRISNSPHGFILTSKKTNNQTHINKQSVIGFIEIIPPNSSPRNSIKSIFFLLIKAPIHCGFDIIRRMLVMLIAVDDIPSRILKKYVSGYWELGVITIDIDKQCRGYGSEMLSLAHKYCKDKNENVPIFLKSVTPRALKFYLKNGYKIISIIHVNEKLTCHGLLYHSNEQLLNKYVNLIKNDSHQFEETFNLFQEILPKTMIQWIISILLLLILVPIIIIYSTIVMLLRMLKIAKWDKE